MHSAIEAFRRHKLAALEAFDLYADLCSGNPPPRVPGCSTSIRMAVRLDRGMTIEEAAAREYVYRWHLAIKAPDQCNATGRRSHDPRDRNPYACISIFGQPHTIGM